MKPKILSHLDWIIKVIQCPSCYADDWSEHEQGITCNQCKITYPVRSGSVDFIFTLSKKLKDPEESFIYERAAENWGEYFDKLDLRIVPETYHCNDFLNFFGLRHPLYKGIVLEIGCGPGFDAHRKAQSNPEFPYFGIDLGRQIEGIALRDKDISNLHYMRGDALNLPMKKEEVNFIVSFGVFHHTANPQKCMDEAWRVLKPGGRICIYLYTNHENNFLKLMGTKVEKMLLSLTAVLPTKARKMFCWALSPLILLIFSWPGQIIKRIPPLKKLGNSFPLHWGTTPASIFGDLQDRLCSPVNHRYSKKEFESLFANSGFSNLEIVTTTGGHFGYAEKA
jgi:SAM-dependent methyltransferase